MEDNVLKKDGIGTTAIRLIK